MDEKLDLEQIRRLENNCQYIANMRPVFNRRALYSDTTANYISPGDHSIQNRQKQRGQSGSGDKRQSICDEQGGIRQAF